MRDIILITSNGYAGPGLSTVLAAVLAEAGASLLDIRQNRIQGLVSLGLVAELPVEHELSVLTETLERRAAERGARLHVARLDASSYATWQAAEASPRHILTLMSRHIEAAQVQRVGELVEAQGLSIERIEPLSAPGARGRAALEFTLVGEPADPEALRAAFFSVTQELNMDIGYQADTLFRRHRRLAVFDMDSTLIQAEVIDELAKAAGIGERVAAITERAMRGELDFRASFKERLALLKGLPESVLEDIGAGLRLSEGAEHLFAELKRLGYKTAILSGGFTYFARQIQARLGIDYVFANELETVDGKVTGVAVEPIVDAQRKADLLRELAMKEGVSLEQTIAVGDGANDLPMLALAGLGVAFRAKPLVRQSARQSITTLGLDGVLYLLGVRDRDGTS
ncbi:phosphoserine phosphatase [Pseudomonas duriflava]|uniref:Phosphoserine phosphatase n=1 Tax=Pseudomonas duriflava TaxID=459528 RepID=A0A562Q6L0_9PSED|nr:phosphoserine phosphatase SerB [Pseudomonas duriflava]TWI52405.1 phosphoserine phosphatase [Pseudomonas duriflava]